MLNLNQECWKGISKMVSICERVCPGILMNGRFGANVIHSQLVNMELIKFLHYTERYSLTTVCFKAALVDINFSNYYLHIHVNMAGFNFYSKHFLWASKSRLGHVLFLK